MTIEKFPETNEIVSIWNLYPNSELANYYKNFIEVEEERFNLMKTAYEKISSAVNPSDIKQMKYSTFKKYDDHCGVDYNNNWKFAKYSNNFKYIIITRKGDSNSILIISEDRFEEFVAFVINSKNFDDTYNLSTIENETSHDDRYSLDDVVRLTAKWVSTKTKISPEEKQRKNDAARTLKNGKFMHSTLLPGSPIMFNINRTTLKPIDSEDRNHIEEKDRCGVDGKIKEIDIIANKLIVHEVSPMYKDDPLEPELKGKIFTLPLENEKFTNYIPSNPYGREVHDMSLNEFKRSKMKKKKILKEDYSLEIGNGQALAKQVVVGGDPSDILRRRLKYVILNFIKDNPKYQKMPNPTANDTITNSNLSLYEEESTGETLNSTNNIKIGLAKQLAQLGGKDKVYNVKLIDNRPGKENKTVQMKFDSSGEIHAFNISDETKPTNEGLAKSLMIGAVCTILATGMVSCKKEPIETEQTVSQPVVLNSSNYMQLFKSNAGTPEMDVASGKLGGSDAVRLTKSFFNNKFKDFDIDVWRQENTKMPDDVWVERARITVTSTEKNKLKLYGNAIYDLEYTSNGWSYTNASKTFILKLVWDGKTLSFYENDLKMASFTR